MKFKGYDYQDYAINFIKSNLVAAVFLDMGLGKTIITLSAIKDLINENKVKKVLVIAPLRVAKNTDCPVCLALFSPENNIDKENGFSIYKQGCISKIGTFNVLSKLAVKSICNRENWIFNDPDGEIGIICCDNTKCASIKFVHGEEINSETIKVTSRAKTRVGGIPKDINIELFIKKCNDVLKEYREKTQDVFLTSFKGLRDDKMYRRRLDFDTAKNIMGYVLEVMLND